MKTAMLALAIALGLSMFASRLARFGRAVLSMLSSASPPSKLSELRRVTRITTDVRRHVPELDGIRGYACLSVLLEHVIIGPMQPALGSFVQPLQNHTTMLNLGGVDCFFVLSGFLIGGILMDSRDKPHFFKKFWTRRVARIFPVLYVLLLTYAAALTLRAHVDLPVLDKWLLALPIPPFWTYATFTQSFPIAAGGYGGPRWVGITWSLAIEEQFYLFFPFVVYFLSRRSLTIVALACIAVSPFLRELFERLYGNWYAAYVLLPSRTDGLMFGVIVAIVVRNSRALLTAIKFRWVLDALALTILFGIVTNSAFTQFWILPFTSAGPFAPFKQSLLAMLFAILILRVFLYSNSMLNRLLRSQLLAGIGLISYALYMYHQFVNGLMHGFLYGEEPTIASVPQLFVGLLVVACAILLATLSYFYIEKPIRGWGHRLSASFGNSTPHKARADARTLIRRHGVRVTRN